MLRVCAQQQEEQARRQWGELNRRMDALDSIEEGRRSSAAAGVSDDAFMQWALAQVRVCLWAAMRLLSCATDSLGTVCELIAGQTARAAPSRPKLTRTLTAPASHAVQVLVAKPHGLGISSSLIRATRAGADRSTRKRRGWTKWRNGWRRVWRENCMVRWSCSSHPCRLAQRRNPPAQRRPPLTAPATFEGWWP